MEVTSSTILLFLVVTHFLVFLFLQNSFKNKLEQIPHQEFEQLTQTQHILLGISQFLEAQFQDVKQKPHDMIETAKSMIPLMIGKKLFPTFFDEIMPGFGPTPPPSSSLTENTNEPHGERSEVEEE